MSDTKRHFCVGHEHYATLEIKMARFNFIHVPYGIYSVVSKCNNNEFLFDAHEKFELYLQHLIYCKKKLGFKIYDICCMHNHVHELYQVTEELTIARILHDVKGHFSRKFNTLFGRSGHFWRNKCFYKIVQDESYAYQSSYYYHWNPVRAGLVSHPRDWPFSGYRFHMENDRTGIIGKLLDPFPDIEPMEIILNSAPRSDFEQLLNGTSHQFIGNNNFVEEMMKKYQSLNK